MKNPSLTAPVLAFVLSLSSVEAQEAQEARLGQHVQPICEQVLKQQTPQTQLIREMVQMIQLNNKYTLNKWYHEIKKFDEQTPDPCLDFGGAEEKHVRPVSHHIFTLAGSIKFGIYSEEVTGVSLEEAKAKLIDFIHSASYRHKVNNKVNRRAWGYQWQSALWTAQIALGAWLVWDLLPAEDQDMVVKMLIAESDRFNAAKPPYFKDRAGNVLFKGDSKSEENAWNSNAIALAAAMMPNHEKAPLWRQASLIYQLSAYSAPKDLEGTHIVDGLCMGEVLEGSNINDDGTVTNHGILHPDYMVAIMHNVCNIWVNQMGGLEPLESSTHNGGLIYKALTQNTYNGKTIYQKSPEGKASCLLYFPQGNDWIGDRQANYWLMDIMAEQFGWGKELSIPPLAWAQARSTEMLRMMQRDTTGQYYQSVSENNFDSREEWLGLHLMWGYIAFKLSLSSEK